MLQLQAFHLSIIYFDKKTSDMDITINLFKLRYQFQLILPSRHTICACFILLTLNILPSVAANDTTKIDATTKIKLAQLTQEFNELSQQYYLNVSRSITNATPATSLKALIKTVEALEASGDITRAIATVIDNNAILVKYSSYKEINDIIEFLLKHDLITLAEEYYQLITMNADVYVTSKTDYLFARYYFNYQDYLTTIRYVTSISLAEVLSEEQKDYTTLIFGASLQEIQKHREAIPILQKISPDSIYYSYAQLNIAIANIRQGWWTDGHLAIKNALQHTTSENNNDPINNELKNRLYLVLGYSQFQNEFYRNARDNFRKIELDSIYINRALLGLGLSALSQKDYDAALNAFTYLKNSKTADLAHAEAHIMLPYTYEIMNEIEQATILYTESIAFFEKKVLDITKKNLQLKNLPIKALVMECNKDNKAISQMLSITQRMLTEANSDEMRSKVANILHKLQDTCTTMADHANATMIENIQSYQSQSQFALARLYDKQ